MIPAFSIFGSLIVALVALYGVRINNATNRAAITAADDRNKETLKAAQQNIEAANAAAADREHEKWRREAVLTCVVSIQEASTAVIQRLSDWREWPTETEEEVDQICRELEKVLRGVEPIISRLTILTRRNLNAHSTFLLREIRGMIRSTQSLVGAGFYDPDARSQEEIAEEVATGKLHDDWIDALRQREGALLELARDELATT